MLRLLGQAHPGGRHTVRPRVYVPQVRVPREQVPRVQARHQGAAAVLHVVAEERIPEGGYIALYSVTGGVLTWSYPRVFSAYVWGNPLFSTQIADRPNYSFFDGGGGL